MPEEEKIYNTLKVTETWLDIAKACIESKTVEEISEAVGQSVYETGKDLKRLEEEGVVQYTAEGKWVTTASAQNVMKKYWGIS